MGHVQLINGKNPDLDLYLSKSKYALKINFDNKLYIHFTESYVKNSVNDREARQDLLFIMVRPQAFAYHQNSLFLIRYTRTNINFTTNCIIRQWLISSYSIIAMITLTYPLTLIQWVSSINVKLEIKNIISSMISIFSNNTSIIHSCFQSKWLIVNSTINEVIIY